MINSTTPAAGITEDMVVQREAAVRLLRYVVPSYAAGEYEKVSGQTQIEADKAMDVDEEEHVVEYDDETVPNDLLQGGDDSTMDVDEPPNEEPPEPNAPMQVDEEQPGPNASTQGDEEQASDDAVYDAEEPSQSEGVTTVRGQTKKMKEVFVAPRGVVDSKETHGQAKSVWKFNRRRTNLKTGRPSR